MLWFAIGSVILLQIIVIHWKPAQILFTTTDLSQMDWLIACLVAAAILVLEELRKLLKQRLNLT